MATRIIREGFVQSSIGQRSRKAAGSNANGAMAGYMGRGMGIQGAGGFMNAASNTNMQQMQQQAQYQQMMNQQQAQQMQQAQYGQPQGGQQPSGDTWTCTCGAVNTGNFCPNCGGRPVRLQPPGPVPAEQSTRKILSELRATRP